VERDKKSASEDDANAKRHKQSAGRTREEKGDVIELRSDQRSAAKERIRNELANKATVSLPSFPVRFQDSNGDLHCALRASGLRSWGLLGAKCKALNCQTVNHLTGSPQHYQRYESISPLQVSSLSR
jgi:hypothetical protein